MPPPLSRDEAGAHLRGDGTRRAPPPAPCGAAGCQPDPAPHTQPRRLRRQVGARSRPGDAGPTREGGMPGSRRARSGAGPRPRRDGRAVAAAAAPPSRCSSQRRGSGRSQPAWAGRQRAASAALPARPAACGGLPAPARPADSR